MYDTVFINFYQDSFNYRSKNFFFFFFKQKNNGRRNLKTGQFYRRADSVAVYQRCWLDGIFRKKVCMKVVGYLKSDTLWNTH